MSPCVRGARSVRRLGTGAPRVSERSSTQSTQSGGAHGSCRSLVSGTSDDITVVVTVVAVVSKVVFALHLHLYFASTQAFKA